MCHYCGVRSGEDCIGLCHSFQIVALCSHSLHDFFMSSMFSWCSSVEGVGAPYMIFTVPVYPPFPVVVTTIFCSWCAHWEKIISPTSWGRRIVVSTFWCHHWKSLFVTEGWFVFTSSWRRRFYGLLLLWILSPFIADLLVGLGVQRGRMAPSSWLRFPRGRFCWLHLSCKIDAAAW